MAKRWYYETWLPFWNIEKKAIPAFIMGTFWFIVRNLLYVLIAGALFLVAREVGDPIWNSYQIKSLKEEKDSLKVMLVDTVAKVEARKDSIVSTVKTEKQKEINNLVITIDPLEKKDLRKIVKKDTLVIIRLDSSRKDTMH